METESEKPGRATITLTVSVDAELLALVEERCKGLNRTRSNYINTLILADLGEKIA
jgi:hypothetical protein